MQEDIETLKDSTMATLLSDKIDIRVIHIIREILGHYILKKRSFCHDGRVGRHA